MASMGGPILHRRELLALLGIGGGAVAASILPTLKALAQSRKDTLVIGIDTSDSTELDPVRDLHYTPPMTISACYEALLTMSPGDYINLKPRLATKWERTPDGKGWRFTLRENVKFVSGNPMTAHDVKFSLDRVRHIRYQAAQYLTNVEAINVVDDKTVDIVLKKPEEPILTILAAPSFVVTDRKVVEEHGGVSTPDSKEKDKATEWLNQNSAGTGPYKLVGWVRNSQIQLVANPNYWEGKPPFQRVVVRHFEDGAAQLLALRRGDIDVAFNLLPEQVATLKDEKDVWVNGLTSLDFVYLALSHNPEFNKALANKKARQAIGYAIDYEGIKNSLLGGAATRPANFIPVGSSRLHRGGNTPNRLPRRSRQVPEAFGGSRVSRRLRVRGHLRHEHRGGDLVSRHGAEDSIRSRTRRHQAQDQPDAPGQRAHALQRRQDELGDHVLESAGR